MPAQVDIRISNSKLKTYLRCRRKYYYRYVLGLSPKQKSVQLERGSWIHSLLQTYYDGEDWKAEHKFLTRKFNNLFEEQREELGDLPTECLRIMKSYLRYYPDDFERFVVVDSEMDEIVELPNGVRLQIIVDLIMEDRQTGLLWAWDHKTRKSFADSDSMIMDPQLTLYYTGLEMMGYWPMGGVTYNEICTKVPTVPRLLQSGGLSKAKNIDTDVYTYMQAIKLHDLDPNNYRDILSHIAVKQKDRWFRRVNLPKDPPMIKTVTREAMRTAELIAETEENRDFIRTFIPQSCKWDCEFRDLCIAQMHGADIKPMIKMNFETKEQRKKREMIERRRERRERGQK